MTTLAQVPSLVQSHSVFNCNGTLFSRISGEYYVVYSYGTHFPVAMRKRTHDGVWLVNEDKYSATTSRHQSKVRQGVSASAFASSPSNTQQLKEMLCGVSA